MALGDEMRGLAGLPPFDRLEPGAIRLIALSAETRILRAGETLFRKGEPSDGGFVLLSGTIALENGGGAPVFVTPPALVGEAALLTETVRPADARVRAPASVLKVPRTLFLRVLSEYPGSAARLRAVLAERVIALQADYDRLREAFAE